MKENFEKELREINKISKKEPSAEDIFEHVGGELQKPETVYNVFKYQEEKREIMEELHKKFQVIDEGGPVTGFVRGETRTIGNWNEEQKMGYFTLPGGKVLPVTEGELMTDGVWGVSYALEANTPHHIKKRFVITEAKRRMMEVLNDQIRHKRPTTAKKRIETEYDTKHILQVRNSGFVAEKLVETFFEKIIIDSKLPIKIEEVDMYEDAARKIDFLLHVPQHARGVEIEKEEKKDIGIQLTISPNQNMLRHKEKQISQAKNYTGSNVHIDDIVLACIPLKHCVEIYDEWKHKGMMPGGPTKLWDISQKEMVFRGVLKGIVLEEEIDEMWKKINAIK